MKRVIGLETLVAAEMYSERLARFDRVAHGQEQLDRAVRLRTGFDLDGAPGIRARPTR